MESPTPFSSEYLVLFTPPNPLLDLSPTDLSLEINELIQAMKNKTNDLPTRAFAELSSTMKSPKIAFSTFRGKPLAMALYQLKRKRVMRVPGQVKENNQRSRKPPSVPLAEYAKGKFLNLQTTAPAIPTESSLMDTTRTHKSSEQVLLIMTEPVLPASPPNTESNPQPCATLTVEDDATTATQAVILEVGLPFLTKLTFPMSTSDEVVSFSCTTLLYLNSLKTSHSFFVVEIFFTNSITHILFHSFK